MSEQTTPFDAAKHWMDQERGRHSLAIDFDVDGRNVVVRLVPETNPRWVVGDGLPHEMELVLVIGQAVNLTLSNAPPDTTIRLEGGGQVRIVGEDYQFRGPAIEGEGRIDVHGDGALADVTFRASETGKTIGCGP